MLTFSSDSGAASEFITGEMAGASLREKMLTDPNSCNATDLTLFSHCNTDTRTVNILLKYCFYIPVLK